MPVILVTPQDPTHLLVQGEQMRAAALQTLVNAYWPIVTDDETDGTMPLSPNVVLAGMQTYDPMMVLYSTSTDVLMSQFDGSRVSNHACISTATGALVPVETGRKCLLNNFVQATNRFTLSGVSRDSTGAALGNCRVVLYETGRIAVDGLTHAQMPSAGNPEKVEADTESPVVAEMISDGSGNFSFNTPMNTAYQITGYKAGSPDVAGITVNTLTPTHTG